MLDGMKDRSGGEIERTAKRRIIGSAAGPNKQKRTCHFAGKTRKIELISNRHKSLMALSKTADGSGWRRPQTDGGFRMIDGKGNSADRVVESRSSLACG